MAAPIAAVLVAAGRGERMGGEKLWIELWGRPVWRWSLDNLLAVPGLIGVAVVAPADALERFTQALPAEGANRCWVVAGGAERSNSALASSSSGRSAKMSRWTGIRAPGSRSTILE